MEMTRVDTIGNKKTSYNLLAPSEAYKMETTNKPEGSKRYRCLLIVICFLSILFLISLLVGFLGYRQTNSEIEKLKNEVSQLRSELQSRIDNENKKLPEKPNNDDVEESRRRYEAHSKWVNETLTNETNNMNTWKEGIEKSVEAASQDLSKKIDNASLETRQLYSDLSVSVNESKKEIVTLKTDFEQMQQRINTVDQSLSSYAASAADEKNAIQTINHQLEEFNKTIIQQVLDLNNALHMMNKSLSASIQSSEEDTSSKLNAINQALLTEVDIFRNKTMAIQHTIIEMNATIHSLSRTLAPDEEAEQLKGELASITSNSSDDAISVSNDELRRVKEELKSLQERVTTDIDTISIEENKLQRNVTKIDDGFKSLKVEVDKIFGKTVSLDNRIERLANLVQKVLEKNKP